MNDNEMVDFIQSRSKIVTVGPTVREIAAHFGCSTSTVAYHLQRMQTKGRIEHSHRSCYVVSDQESRAQARSSACDSQGEVTA